MGFPIRPVKLYSAFLANIRSQGVAISKTPLFFKDQKLATFTSASSLANRRILPFIATSKGSAFSSAIENIRRYSSAQQREVVVSQFEAYRDVNLNGKIDLLIYNGLRVIGINMPPEEPKIYIPVKTKVTDKELAAAWNEIKQKRNKFEEFKPGKHAEKFI